MWNYEYFIDENSRIKINVFESKFALNYLYFFKNKWICVARIDNYKHKGKASCHIH